IRLRELAEVDVARHRRLERAAVAADPLRQRALDLVVVPLADAGGRMRRDVRRARRAPRVLEFISSPAPPVHVVLRAVGSAGMTLHAVRDGGEVEATLDRV